MGQNEQDEAEGKELLTLELELMDVHAKLKELDARVMRAIDRLKILWREKVAALNKGR